MRWKVPQIWPAGDVVIIGGGPSFKKVDQSVLKSLSLQGDIHVIGINKAYREIPDSGEWMHVLWYGDSKFYHTFRRLKERGLYTFPGLRVCCDAQSSGDAAIKVLGRDHRSKHEGLSTDPTLVYWGGNSGTSCINLAYHFTGAGGRAFLFGFDMNPEEKQQGITHWHEGYTEFNVKGQAMNAKVKACEYYKSWRTKLEILAKRARQLHFTILNVNPSSAIESFPKITFDEFVNLVKKEKANG
jgi:hypothetical protein